MILRTIKCDVCKREQTEEQPNIGWPGWGHLAGIKLDGVDNPNLCPVHLKLAADAIDAEKRVLGAENNGVD